MLVLYSMPFNTINRLEPEKKRDNMRHRIFTYLKR
jgi:hypothetical protein